MYLLATPALSPEVMPTDTSSSLSGGLPCVQTLTRIRCASASQFCTILGSRLRGALGPFLLPFLLPCPNPPCLRITLLLRYGVCAVSFPLGSWNFWFQF